MPQETWVQAPYGHSLRLVFSVRWVGVLVTAHLRVTRKFWGGVVPGQGRRWETSGERASGAARKYTVSRLNNSLAV